MNLIKDNRPDVKKSRGTAYHRIPYAEFAEAVQNMRQTLSAKKRDELIIPGRNRGFALFSASGI